MLGSGVRNTTGPGVPGAWNRQGISAVTQRRFIRMGLGLAAVCAAGLLTACGPVYDPKGFNRVMTSPSSSRVDTALAAMSRGEYGVAEQSLSAALDADPKDPYALLAMGMLYQNTNRPQKAEALYQQILLLNPTATISSGPWGDMRQRSVRDVAEENLQALGGGSRPGALSYPNLKKNDPPAGAALPPNGLGAAGQRFAVFKSLVDENLATPEEWMARRGQNIGALLPLTHGAPGTGLDRPSPDAKAVGNRLKALAAAFEGRGISASQHAMERQAILDGVLPEQPKVRASAPPVPRGVMEAADAIGRLDRLRANNVISPGEYEDERAAIERALRGGTPRPKPTAPAPKPVEAPPAAAAQAPQQLMPQAPAPGTPANAQPGASINNPAAVLQTGRMANQTVPDPADFSNPDADSPIGAGGIVAVHLASFKNQELADKGWKEMIGRYPDLAAITPRVTQVTLPDQGTVFRLNAGPFADRAKAQEFCTKLKGQYCEVVFLGG